MSPNPQEPADLVTFTEEILNAKLHFLCSVLNLFYQTEPNHFRAHEKKTEDFFIFTASLCLY